MAEPATAKAEKIVKQKLSVFNWEGLDKKGKRLQGTTEAISVAYAQGHLDLYPPVRHHGRGRHSDRAGH